MNALPDSSGTEVDESLSGVEQRFEHIYSTLRSRICLLDYKPGTRLSEVALAREFDVSRTPVRKVLGRLELEGLLEIRHGVGTLVTEIDFDYLAEVYQVRMELVCHLGIMAPMPPSEELLASIHETLERTRQVGSDENPKRLFAQVNIEFFEQLMQLVGNRALREVATLLFYRSSRMWPYLMRDETVAMEAEMFANEIRETLQLLESGQMVAVGNLRRRHIAMALQRLKLMSTENGLVA
ncbi:GntR family transcriptional regulator [Marinobacterium lutimaris]|uniref:Transcriptional regulator, GntR family n=1 Tax=Marinobacterium lutimaris TaxID=568106 RepID=A0A1H6D0F4_9GAMM|nr:GntR family transcriptional regulator [Marinobacterium lutimaris]SEG78534.1 transcriptional regulator, GntR family [Marinobacterium lutimaris]